MFFSTSPREPTCVRNTHFLAAANYVLQLLLPSVDAHSMPRYLRTHPSSTGPAQMDVIVCGLSDMGTGQRPAGGGSGTHLEIDLGAGNTVWHSVLDWRPRFGQMFPPRKKLREYRSCVGYGPTEGIT
eukprot:5257671-Pyramimonas_sp.AAC.1